MSKKKKVKSIMNICPTNEDWEAFYYDEENYMLNSKPLSNSYHHFFIVVDLYFKITEVYIAVFLFVS